MAEISILDQKVVKSFSVIPYTHVHLSLLGMLTAFYQDEETGSPLGGLG